MSEPVGRANGWHGWFLATQWRALIGADLVADRLVVPMHVTRLHR